MEKGKLRIGILGPGRIVERVYKDMHKVSGIEFTAVGSRSLERAKQAAERYGIQHAFGSYEELASSEDVDLIYIATPNNCHMEQAMLCMDHGKHVLCEKPMALNEHQVKRMIACARKNHVFLMEAMWTRFFPATRKLVELIESGAIGKPQHVMTDFCFYSEYDPASRVYSRELAGGGLLDVGIYTMAATSLVMGYEPVHTRGYCHMAPTGVDQLASVLTQYADGQTAQQVCGLSTLSAHSCVVLGEKGRIEVPNFWHPTSLSLFENSIQVDLPGKETPFLFEPEQEGFRHEFAHVRDCILEGRTESPLMTLEETLALSRLMTGLRRAWGVKYPEEE